MRRLTPSVFIPFLLVVPIVASASTSERFAAASPVQEMLTDQSLELLPRLSFERATLELVGPNGLKLRKHFEADHRLQLDLSTETGEPMADGRYSYLLRLFVPGRRGAVTKHGIFFIANGRAVSKMGLTPLTSETVGNSSPHLPSDPTPLASATSDGFFILDTDQNGITLLSLESIYSSLDYPGPYPLGSQNLANSFGYGQLSYIDPAVTFAVNSIFTNPYGQVGIGGTLPIVALDVYGDSIFDGDVSILSSRESKTNFVSVDASEILSQVVQMPLHTWSFKRDSQTVHLGPLAEDFFGAFDLGSDEQHLSPIDIAGVALAAIQGLNEEVGRLEDANKGLRFVASFAILLSLAGLVSIALLARRLV